jgi:uncharacterized metal-binding protein
MLVLKVTERNFDKAIKLSRKENCSLNCAVAVAARDNLKLVLSSIGFTILNLSDKSSLKCIEGDMPKFTRAFDSLYPYDDIDIILELRSTLPLTLKFKSNT